MTKHAAAPTSRRLRTRLRGETSRQVIATVISTALVLQPIAAAAGPTDGVVKAGNASITTTDGHTRIEQIDARVVIDWQSFDIEASETVTFNQPTTRAVALNRVLDGLPTNVRGALEANGHVWIVNSHGITFHAGSVVDVGGLLATTADITNTDFIAGRNNFSIPGQPGAQVINKGSITFGQAGLAGLVAPGAQNQGTIAGKLGTVIVAGERTFAIDFAGDGLFAFEPTGASNFAGKASNSGSISSDGGYILIAARTANRLVDESVSMSGVVEAKTASMRDGKIVLSGGDGLVNVAGRIDASGEGRQRGGSIKVSGGRIDVKGTAAIDVSGGSAGGTVEIGGGYQGASMGTGLRNAQDTLVQRGATISADAVKHGDGGTAIVWADGATGYRGSISARGGALRGNGGTAEVSGKQALGFNGVVDLSAPSGKSGSLFLDPDEVVIDDPGADDAELGDQEILFADGGPIFTISPSALAASVNTANTTVQANNTITQNAGAVVDLSGGAANSLTLATTTGDITLNDTFVGSGGDLNFTAGGSVNVSGALSNAGNINATASADVNVGADITTTAGGNIALTADSPLLLGNINANGNLIANSGGAITQTADAGVGNNIDVTGTSMLTAGAGSDVTLTAASNDFTGAVSASGAAIQLTDINAIILGDIDASNTLTVNAGNAIDQTIGGGVGDAIDVTGAAEFTAVNDITLTNAENVFGDLVNASGASISLTDDSPLLLGNINANGNLIANSGGAITQTADAGVGNNIDVTGTSMLTAVAGSDVTLTAASNDFTGAVSASGAAIQLTDINAIILGDIDASNTLTVNAGNAIDQTIGGGVGDAIDVTGAAEFTAVNDITLTNAENVFGDLVNASGASISLTDDSPLLLGNINANGNLIANSGGAITQTADAGVGNNIDVTGTSMLTAGAGSDVTLTAASNDFTGAVSASGAAIQLTDINAIILGDIDASNTLTVNAGNAIDQTIGGGVGDAIDVTGAAEFTAVNDITLTNAENVFGDLVNASGASISLTDDSPLLLGNINANGNLIANSGGAITQTADAGVGNNIDVTGTSMLTPVAGSDVTLTAASNDFTGAVSASGAAIQLTDINAIILGDIDASNTLTVNAGNAIDQTIGGGVGDAIDVTGAAEFTAVNDITLTNAENVFGDLVNASGASISLTDDSPLLLGNINANGNLIANSGGAITQTADAGVGNNIDVTGTSMLTAGAGSDVTLTAASNDFTGAVSASGAAIQLTDINAIILGDIDAGGMLSVAASGSITQDDTGGDGVDVTGTTTLTALGFDIVLDSALNNFSGAVDATGANITLTDADTILLGDIDASNTLTVNAGNAIDQTIGGGVGDAIDVTGAAEFTAVNDITLTNAENVFGDLVNASGASISLTDDSPLLLGNINANGNLIANSGGAITQTADAGVGNNIDVTGTSMLTAVAGSDVTLTAASNDFTGAVSASGAAIQLTDINAIILGDIDASNTLTVNAGNAIDQTIGGGVGDAIDVTGAAEFTAVNDITLTNAENVFGDLVNASGASISLTDDSPLLLGNINANGNLIANSGGAITQTADAGVGNNIDVTGTSMLTAGAGSDVTLTAASNDFTGAVSASGAAIQLTDINAIILGDIDAGGMLSVAASGSITQDDTGGDGVDVTGTTTLTALGFDIVLDSALNNFSGAVDATGANITLTDADTILLGDIDASNTLTVNAGNAIDQTIGGGVGDAIDVTGAAEFTAVNDITLTNAENVFGDLVNASGASISLTDDSPLLLGNINANGNLIANSGGAITQTADAGVGNNIDVTGTSMLTAAAGSDVTLTAASNDFTGAVSASGAAIQLTDINAIILGDIDASNTLTVNAGNAIDQTIGGGVGDAIDVTGAAEFTAVNDITLTNAENVFGDLVNASGASISLTDDSPLLLGNINANGNLIANSGGAITQTADAGVGNNIDVTGTSMLTAVAGSDVTLTAASNDFTGAVSASGAAIQLTDINAIILGDIDASNTLTVNAGNAIDQTIGGGVGDAIDVTGAAEFTAVNDITLTNAENVFGDLVNASGASISLTDDSPLLLGNINANGNLIANSGGAITQTADAGVGNNIDVTGTSMLTAGAGSDVTLTAASNDFTGAVSASGAAIQLTDINAIILGDIDAGGMLSVAASGSITQDDTGGDGVDVTGTTTLTALGFDIVLDSALNNFSGAVDATGANITLTDADTILLGDIDASNTLTVNAGNAIDQTIGGGVGDAIDVTGAAEFTAVNDITLTNAENVFGDLVNASGASISLTDDSPLLLGNINANGNLIANSGGAITQTADAGVGNNIDVTGTSMLTPVAGSDVTLTAASNDFTGAVSASGAAIQLTDINAIILGDIDASNTLTVNAGNAIDQTIGGGVGDAIDVTGAAEFTAVNDITLTNAENVFGDLVNASGASISLTDDSPLLLGNINANGNLIANSGGAITQTADAGVGNNIDVTGTSMLTAGAGSDVTLTAASNDFTGAVSASGAAIQLTDINAIILGDIDAGGMLSVAASGSITQDDTGGDGVDVTGTTTLTALGFDIVLDSALNNFSGAVDATGANITLTDADTILLGDIDASNTLTVNAGNAIDQTIGGGVGDAIDVTGAAEFTAVNDITLTNAENSASILQTSPAGVGDAIDVFGTTNLSAATEITLDTAVNDFADAVSALNAAGTDIAIADIDAILLGDIDASQTLTVDAGDAIQQTAAGLGAAINVGSDASFSAIGDVLLGNTSNDFNGFVVPAEEQ